MSDTRIPDPIEALEPTVWGDMSGRVDFDHDDITMVPGVRVVPADRHPALEFSPERGDYVIEFEPNAVIHVVVNGVHLATVYEDESRTLITHPNDVIRPGRR